MIDKLFFEELGEERIIYYIKYNYCNGFYIHIGHIVGRTWLLQTVITKNVLHQ